MTHDEKLIKDGLETYRSTLALQINDLELNPARAKINVAKTVVVAIVALFVILSPGCGGSTTKHGGRVQIGGPSVAQIQAFLNEKLNPHPAPTPSSQLPSGATEVERAIAKSKEFDRYPIPHIDSQTTCIDEGANRFKCLTTYSRHQQENELTNATCSRHTSPLALSKQPKRDDRTGQSQASIA